MNDCNPDVSFWSHDGVDMGRFARFTADLASRHASANTVPIDMTGKTGTTDDPTRDEILGSGTIETALALSSNRASDELSMSSHDLAELDHWRRLGVAVSGAFKFENIQPCINVKDLGGTNG